MYRRRFLKAGVLGLAGAGLIPRTEAARARSGREILLNSNENPLELPAVTRKAVIDGLVDAGRYPIFKEGPLLEKLARKHRVAEDQIVLGNGSSEVIQMAVQALPREGARIVVPDPTFESVADYAAALQLRVEKVPLNAAHSHDLREMRNIAEASPRGAFVYICNPNNPTGTLTSSRALEEWIDSATGDICFLVDEAYFDYVEEPSYRTFSGWTESRRNLVVTRTFSKVYGLAGLRIGYGIAHPDTAARLRKFASDINMNQVALTAAMAILDEIDHVRQTLEINRRGMRILLDSLQELGVDYIPGSANFLMHRVRGELSLFIDRMREDSIRVGRPFPPLTSYCRVSIGTPEEMEQYSRTLKTFRSRGWI